MEVGKSFSKTDSLRHGQEASPLLGWLEAMLDLQRRMETKLTVLADDQRTIASAVLSGSSRAQSPMTCRKSVVSYSNSLASASVRGSVCHQPSGQTFSTTPAFTAAPTTFTTAPEEVEVQEIVRRPACGFFEKLAEAERCIGRGNILAPPEAALFLEANPGTMLLDVSDTDAPALPKAYRITLGQIYVKASSDVQEWKDPLLADRDKDLPLLVTCTYGGRSKIAAQVLLDYGFTNVKTVEGGNVAWRACSSPLCNNPAVTRGLPTSWPVTVPQHPCYGKLENAELASLQDAWMMELDGPAMIHQQSTHAMEDGNGNGTSKFAERQAFLLHPSSKRRVVLDVLSILVLTFDLVTVPWYVAWDVKIEGWLYVSTLAIAIFWTCNILASFRSGYYKNGKLIMNPKKIALRYLRTWFFPDFVVVGSEWVGQILFLRGEDVGLISLTKWGRLLRLFGMVRFVKFSDVFARILDRSFWSPGLLIFVQVIRLLFTIVYLNHFCACLWWGIGRAAHSNTGLRWVEQLVDSGEYTYEEADVGYQYVVSLHWAVTQILAGSMQVNATNSTEHFFTAACLISGVLFLSCLVSTLTAKMTQLRMLTRESNAKVVELHEFLRRKAVGGELGVAIVRQVKESLKEQRPRRMQDLAVWNNVSQKNRRELQRMLCRRHLLRHKFFKLMARMDDKLIRRLCDTALQIGVYEKEDTVFAWGSTAAAAYIVISGTLKYTLEVGTSSLGGLADMEPTMGEAENLVQTNRVICEAALWTQWKHVGTLEACTSTELLVLNANAVGEVLQLNEHARIIACEYSRAYTTRLQNSCEPYSEFPTDLHVPYTSFQEIIPSSRDEVRSFIGQLALQTRVAHLSWTMWAQRLKDDVRSGRRALIAGERGELELVSTIAILNLERGDGSVLVQLGTWNGMRAIESCCLPQTVLRGMELPKDGYERLVRTQLSTLADGVRLLHCSSETDSSKIDTHLVRKTTFRITHYAELEDTKNECSAKLVPGASHLELREHRSMSNLSKQSEDSAEDLAAHTSQEIRPPELEDVIVIAGAPDLPGDPGAGPVLRLFAWMPPSIYHKFTTRLGKKKLKRFLSPLKITEDAAQDAHQAYLESLSPAPQWRQLSESSQWQQGLRSYTAKSTTRLNSLNLEAPVSEARSEASESEGPKFSQL